MKCWRHARVTERDGGVDGSRPEWFAAFLADRGTRKPSAHTLKAYRQDFDAIATLIAGGEDLSGIPLGAIMVEMMRTAFARYAETHEAASIQRCWSTLERAVHVPVHRAAHSGEPNVVSRPTQAREDFAEGTADRFSGCPPGRD